MVPGVARLDADSLTAYAERNERALVILLLLVSIAVQANGIMHYGYIGQDFEDHIFKLSVVFSDPLLVITTQDAPLPYYLCAWLYLLTDGHQVLELFAFGTAAMNAGAVLLFHRLSTLLVGHVFLRLAATMLLTFLPFRIVHSVVFAGDSFTALPFIVVVLLVVGLHAREADRWAKLRILALVLTLALLAKHSFLALLPALALTLLLLVRTGKLNRPQALAFLVLVLLLPGVLGTILLLRSSHRTVHPWKKVPGSGSAMRLDDLLVMKKRDLHLLNAPSYDERDGYGKLSLMVPHRFSYPALLHLGIFTDHLNFFQYDPNRPYIPARSAANQRLMALSVKTSIPLSIAAFLATLWYTARVAALFLRGVRRGQGSFGTREFALLMTVLFGLACYLVIVLALPYLRWAYWSGYWLPRLVMPSVMSFFLLAFAALDELLVRCGPRAVAALALAALIGVTAQSALHVAFLCPWGAYGPMPRIHLSTYR